MTYTVANGGDPDVFASHLGRNKIIQMFQHRVVFVQAAGGDPALHPQRRSLRGGKRRQTHRQVLESSAE